MSKRLFTTPRAWSLRLLLGAMMAACLVMSAAWHQRGPRDGAVRPAREAAVGAARDESRAVQQSASPKLEGRAAQAYMEKPGDGQSLMAAVEATHFGLKWEEHAPFAAQGGGGYLGMSHDQNLNVWFDEDGVTVHPTLAEKDRDKAWRLGFRLKSYGYGVRQTAAAPIVSHQARENRMEYERGGEGARARVVEWYENKSVGIEQGFTFPSRLERGADVSADEPLRLVVAVTGDLRARAKEDGQTVELSKKSGESVLSYSKLTALDADGKQFAARMETNASGDEIALVVEDAGANYPLVIDPITASFEQDLDPAADRQTDARFGFAVAIDGDRAVVGAWRFDTTTNLDAGQAYLFIRSGSTWSYYVNLPPFDSGSAKCGWSVAIRGELVAYGCPGANSNTGRAILYDNATISFKNIAPTNAPAAGDQYGYSVALGGNMVHVGAPTEGSTDTGAVYGFTRNNDGSLQFNYALGGAGVNEQMGASVAADGSNLVVVGAPGFQSGKGKAVFFPGLPTVTVELFANDGQAGDNFGDSVDISGNTAVVGANGDDDVATDAGAAYVFVRAANGTWSQQQKLTASDGRANDHFSIHAVAIEGNMIVVGADEWDAVTSGDNAGAVYIFTRTGTVWTLQEALYSLPANNYGIGVGLSGNTLIVGARGAPNFGTGSAGSARVYRLSCTPPSDSHAVFVFTGESITACPGASLFLSSGHENGAGGVTYQWRKNGVNVLGETGQSFSKSPTEAGVYDVVISNSCGSEISSPATLAFHTRSINPTSQNFSASGSNGIVNVTSTGTCSYTATSNASWITITSGTPGTAPGTVNFTVAANSGTSSRSGTLTIAGQTFTVTQDGTAPAANTFQFSQSSSTVGEGAGSATITVTRAGDLSAAATVEYATTDGAATDRGDYNTTIGRLRFAAGESSKTFAVLVNDDAYAEGAESLNLMLANPSGGPALGTPAVASLSITDNDAVTSASNPIDTTAFYVRQHYVDFFSREPDAGGLAFWSGGIDSCGADAGCREVKRIDTSAAFFLSIEFQETGFLVHRIYRAAFNRLPRYREFVRDSQEIGRGVVVGQTGWEAQLEANKAAFVSEFAGRADFAATYGGMSNAQYVDALNVNAGGSLSQGERDALVAGLNASTETRATVLRKTAEDADLRARETSPAFVLMQYFGYLRRNPDDTPDTDFSGYNFWLGKLNSFGGDYRRAEMVKAFIQSTEYRKRFGQ